RRERRPKADGCCGANLGMASPELSERPRRRTFTAQDKLRILGETDDRAAETPRWVPRRCAVGPHADRGGPMKAMATALLLAELGVTRSHNRPHTSNDKSVLRKLRKPLQNPKVSAALPSTLWLHRGCQKLLPPLFR